MSRSPFLRSIRLAALLAAGWLAACSRPEPEPLPEPAPPAMAPDAPTREPDDAPTDAPGDAPAAPSQPAPEAPSPADPSPAPQPASTSDAPALASMALARTPAKIGVPVDLHYQFQGEALADQPVRLHLAAVPRVEGTDLKISVQQAEGLYLTEGTLNVQKAAASGVYRKQLAVTRGSGGPRELRVLVTMGVGEGSAHSFFTIPLEPGKAPQKRDSVKQQ